MAKKYFDNSDCMHGNLKVYAKKLCNIGGTKLAIWAGIEFCITY